MSMLQYLFRPRFQAHPALDASTSPRFHVLLDAWRRTFPQSTVDPRVDLEDWAENAEQLCVALEHAQRHLGSLELFVDDSVLASTTGQYDFGAIRAIAHPGLAPVDAVERKLNMGRPFLFGGAERRVGDFISGSKYVVMPGRDDMAAADAYFHNPGFWEHSHRHMAFASYDDGEGDVPAGSDLLDILMERRDAGNAFAMVKVAATKRGIARIALGGQSKAQLHQQLVDAFEWTLVELAGRKDALLVQDFVAMKHEYRVFVVDGAPVAGAGCIEEFTPMDNTGAAFDERTREIRISEDGSGRQVEARPDIVARYRKALPGIVQDLIKGNPRMRTFVLDLCMVGDQVAVVEVNGARNAGLYAMKYDAVFAAKVAAAQRALRAQESQDATAQADMAHSVGQPSSAKSESRRPKVR